MDIREVRLVMSANRARGYFFERGRGMILSKSLDRDFLNGLDLPAEASSDAFGHVYVPFEEIPVEEEDVRRLVAGYDPSTQAVVIIEYGPSDRRGPEIVVIPNDFDSKPSIH